MSCSSETVVWGGGHRYNHAPFTSVSPNHQPPPFFNILHIQPKELRLEFTQLWLFLLLQIHCIRVLKPTIPEDRDEAHWAIRAKPWCSCLPPGRDFHRGLLQTDRQLAQCWHRSLRPQAARGEPEQSEQCPRQHLKLHLQHYKPTSGAQHDSASGAPCTSQEGG